MSTIKSGEYSPTSLPAKHKINDFVDVNFFDAGKITDCWVKAVRFSPGKVKYDLDVLVVKDTEENGDVGQKFTRIKNVDSAFVVESPKQVLIREAETKGFVNVKSELINVCYENAVRYLYSLDPEQKV